MFSKIELIKLGYKILGYKITIVQRIMRAKPILLNSLDEKLCGLLCFAPKFICLIIKQVSRSQVFAEEGMHHAA